MLETKRKSMRINTIRRTAPRNTASGPVPGNLIINDKWFSSRELRNCLIGAGLAPNIPVMALKGALITYDEINVTQDLLDANGGQIKHTIQGREVIYKKAGVNQVNLDIDFATVNVTENLLNLAKLSQMYPREAQQQQRPAPAPIDDADVVVDEPIVESDVVNDETVTPPVQPVVHDELVEEVK